MSKRTIYRAGDMTPQQFREIRAGLLMTQAELAETLGYGHKMRVSEFECGRAAIPFHIQRAMESLWEGRAPKRKPVRDWTRGPVSRADGVPDMEKGFKT